MKKWTKEELISDIQQMLSDILELQKIYWDLDESGESETIDYSVNWKDAPKWAEFHAYDINGEGFWYGVYIEEDAVSFSSAAKSGWKVGSSVMNLHKLTWKDSIVPRPLIY
jgi:hypothetical protein